MADELREKVARALAGAACILDGYEDVPVEEAFTRPRYQHLRERYLRLADAAIAAVRAHDAGEKKGE